MMQINCNNRLYKVKKNKAGLIKLGKKQIYEDYDTSVCKVLGYYDYMHKNTGAPSYRLSSIFDKYGIAVYIVYGDEYFNNRHVLAINNSGVVYLLNRFEQYDMKILIKHCFNKIDNEDKAFNMSKFYYEVITSQPFFHMTKVFISKENINNYSEFHNIIKPINIHKELDEYRVSFYVINLTTREILLVNSKINYDGDINISWDCVKEPQYPYPDIID
jgi:hypothetical protein